MTSTHRGISLLPIVHTAAAEDAPAIAALLRDRAPETIPVPEQEIREVVETYRIIRTPRLVVASASLRPLDAERFELRSVAVADAFTGHGLGEHLVRNTQLEAELLDARLLCVTTSPSFFERLGFEETDLSELPPKPERESCPAPRPRVAMCWQAATPDERRKNHASTYLRRSA